MSAGTVKATITHIESFRPAISQNRRKPAPLRWYLPPTLNVIKMYELFKEQLLRKTLILSDIEDYLPPPHSASLKYYTIFNIYL